MTPLAWASEGELGDPRCYLLRPTMVSEEGTGGKEGSDDE
jgi:hypothetical protein